MTTNAPSALLTFLQGIGRSPMASPPALNVLDGAVSFADIHAGYRAAGPMPIGQCMQRHNHREFIRFHNRTERDVRARQLIHVVLDSHATHKRPKVDAWTERHARWAFRFTPTSSFPRGPLACVPAAPDRARCARWLNAVEGFFAELANRRLKRGVRLDRRAAGRHQPLARRDQPATQVVHLDCRSQPHRRRGAPAAPSVRFYPLITLDDAACEI